MKLYPSAPLDFSIIVEERLKKRISDLKTFITSVKVFQDYDDSFSKRKPRIGKRKKF